MKALAYIMFAFLFLGSLGVAFITTILALSAFFSGAFPFGVILGSVSALSLSAVVGSILGMLHVRVLGQAKK